MLTDWLVTSVSNRSWWKLANKNINSCEKSDAIPAVATAMREERKINYLYSHQGEYLLVPNTPVEICRDCGMIYYDAAVLKEIERRFFYSPAE